MVGNDVKERAIALRLEGKTYKQIVESLDGAVSIDWCKRSLKDVKGGTKKSSDEALEKIIALALRPQGCTNYELNGVLYTQFPNQKLEGDYMQSYKRRAKYRNKDCIFRPAWVSPTQPRESQTTLYSLASDLFERLHEYVEDYTNTFPDTDKKTVWMELLKISNGHLNPEGLDKRFERNNTVVQALEERLKK